MRREADLRVDLYRGGLKIGSGHVVPGQHFVPADGGPKPETVPVQIVALEGPRRWQCWSAPMPVHVVKFLEHSIKDK